jgi:hypothetical protein
MSADNMAALLQALSRQDELGEDTQDIKSKNCKCEGLWNSHCSE